MDEMGDIADVRQAQLDLLDALEAMLCQSDSCIIRIGSKLEQVCELLLCESNKCLEKILKKISRYIDKKQVDCANLIEYLFTKIRNFFDADLDRVEWLLTQLALKGGLIQVGQSITIILIEKERCEPDLKWGGTLVLSIREALPFCERLIEVLEEIRNRLPPVIQESPVELLAKEDIPDYPWSPPNGGDRSQKISRIV